MRSDPHPGIPRSLLTRDPNGIEIELFRYRSQPCGRAAQSGISPLKLGHVALYTGDINASIAFYRDQLGFRVSDWMEDFFVFLRCGPDSPHLQFHRLANRGMHHMAFELRDWAHIQMACDWLARSGYKITWGRGATESATTSSSITAILRGRSSSCFTELDTMSDEAAGFFRPRPWHRDRPQRPKVWSAAEGSNLWGGGPPPVTGAETAHLFAQNTPHATPACGAGARRRSAHGPEEQ